MSAATAATCRSARVSSATCARERLPLSGWQEDIDFTCQLRRKGRVVALRSHIGVHLGVKSGRVSGERFGYSQVANPIYLIRKGSVPATFALELMMRNIFANLVKSLWPEPYVDSWGRLKGNLLACSACAERPNPAGTYPQDVRLAAKTKQRERDREQLRPPPLQQRIASTAGSLEPRRAVQTAHYHATRA